MKRPVSSRGFTMVELLVTVGILVIVTAGVATIFNSIGNTVAKGRKLSELNQFAARLEQVMREDFSQMTRDGFLVIVNKNANFGNDVQLFRGEKIDIDNGLYGGFSNNSGRIRRSDEIMFFRRGEFETARRAISPDMIATSNEAAIYYGHGQKRRPDLLTDPDSPLNFFFNPSPWDNNFDNVVDSRLGVTTVGQINPNEFARDWSLLRQVTLLINPQGPGQGVPTDLFGIFRDNPVGRPYLQDSTRQVALQPAARSIFTSLSGTDISGAIIPAADYPRWLFDGSAVANPNFSHFRTSGMVDIVTEDLATIRGMIQGLAVTAAPTDYFNYLPDEPQPNGLDPIVEDRDTFEANYWGDPLNFPKPGDALAMNIGSVATSGAWTAGDAAQTARIRQWMVDALPSRWNLNTPTPEFVSGVRYEDIPTRILFPDDPVTDADKNERAYAEANQEMLGASVFVPRCSEFIVEWSYGFVDHSVPVGAPGFKELMWYGLDRYVDSNKDGLLTGADMLAAEVYSPRSGGAASTDPSYLTTVNRSHGGSTDLVVGRAGAPARLPDDVEIATFGFSTMPSNLGAIWQWPRFVRITMKLADPGDREVEETYQVVFELPELE